MWDQKVEDPLEQRVQEERKGRKLGELEMDVPEETGCGHGWREPQGCVGTSRVTI